MAANIGSRALVLGSGGVTGIAWLTGLLFSLENSGLDINAFERIIGTSAGAAVGAQITSGTSMDELYQRQTDPNKQVAELTPTVNAAGLILKFLPALLAWRTPQKFRQRIGQMARDTQTVSAKERLEVIKARLPNHEWPSHDLSLVAIDAADGEPHCFDNSSQVSLVDAVAASCAVPGVWPVVNMKGHGYVDGGTRSKDNADYAQGAKTILILSPASGKGFSWPRSSLSQEIEILEKSGSQVLSVTPNRQSIEAIGSNSLDPKKREAAAVAGKIQGEKAAGGIITHFI